MSVLSIRLVSQVVYLDDRMYADLKYISTVAKRKAMHAHSSAIEILSHADQMPYCV
jgi:hypothetical protein